MSPDIPASSPAPPGPPARGAADLLLMRWIFLRSLAAIYGVAFLSLWVQITGLVGEQGIHPAGRFLEAVHGKLGPEAYYLLPTLAWLGSGDGALHLLSGLGVGISLLPLFRIAPALSFLLLWALYLSLVSAGGVFLSFQWDALLLEAGFLAVFLAPWKLRPRRDSEPAPSALSVWLVRWLAFRLLFASGVVKLLWNDETWLNLTALHYHYETQPLPTWIGWYAHQLPGWFQKTSVAVMYVIEIGLPFLIFMGRKARLVSLLGQLLLQTAILLTGNYCFFNLLTIALCLLLADDRFLRAILRRPAPGPAALPRPPEPAAKKAATWALAALVAAGSAVELTELGLRAITVGKPAWEVEVPEPALRFQSWLGRFHVLNGYGLFRVMTTSRPEIVVEGSQDGREWKAYEFRWKPGDPARRPRFVAPHQPRLDWQMWFAALGSFRQNPWFAGFLLKLLEGSPPVLSLLEKNPFPEEPPRYVRALLYQYHFTDPATRRATGAWWRRELVGPYTPVLSRESFR